MADAIAQFQSAQQKPKMPGQADNTVAGGGTQAPGGWQQMPDPTMAPKPGSVSAAPGGGSQVVPTPEMQAKKKEIDPKMQTPSMSYGRMFGA